MQVRELTPADVQDRPATVTTSSEMTPRRMLGVLFLWLALKLFGARELRITTTEGPDAR